jgi:hypothetical protein
MNASGKRLQSTADDAAKRLREASDNDAPALGNVGRDAPCESVCYRTGFTSTGKATVCAASSMDTAAARATAAFAATQKTKYLLLRPRFQQLSPLQVLSLKLEFQEETT